MGDCEYTLDYDAQGNLVEASENGTDYHYTDDTEGRVLSKRVWRPSFREYQIHCSMVHMLMMQMETGLPKARMEEPL